MTDIRVVSADEELELDPDDEGQVGPALSFSGMAGGVRLTCTRWSNPAVPGASQAQLPLSA